MPEWGEQQEVALERDNFRDLGLNLKAKRVPWGFVWWLC